MPEASWLGGSGIRHAVTSCAQDALWYLGRLVPDSPAYNVCRAYRVTGHLDVAALRSAWQSVLRRHEILRTTLAELGGQPVQKIAGDDRDALSFSYLGTLPGPQPSAERLCAELAATPMRLSEGPLARLAVAHLVRQEHIVVLLLHQVVSDHRSVSILIDEISECYAAVLAGRPAHDALPAPAAQYGDYARWQREQLTTPRYRRLLDWWVSTLTPPPPPLALPADGALPRGPSSHGGVLRFDWGEGVGRPLAALCGAAGAAPHTVLLAAFQSVLYRYGREERVAVGVPVAVRPRPEFEGLIGPFENTLVVCAGFSGRPIFGEMIRRAARAERDARDHRELPFGHLVKALNPDRDPRRTPLFDVTFTLRDVPEAPLRLPGAAVRPERAESGAVTADLALTVELAGLSVTGSLGFRHSLFGAGAARHLLEQVHTFLGAALEEPGLSVDELVMDHADRVSAAVRSADQTAAGVAERPVHELVHLRARHQPGAAAVAWAGESVTYRELEDHAAFVTRALRACGVAPGAPVAVRLPPGPRQAAVLLGILDAGAHLVCLGAGELGERGRAVLADVRPACLVLDGEPPGDTLAGWYRDELKGQVLDVAVPAGGASRAGGDAAAMAPAAHGGLGARAYVAYTSGSTGTPKGIIHSHGSLAQFVMWLSGESGAGAGSRVAQWAAPGYDASLCEIFAALVAGATLCPVPTRIRANPEKMLGWLATERITLFQTVPSFARELLKVISRQDAAGRLAALDHLLLAGEALPGDVASGLRDALPWVRLINLYGATETILATWHEVTGPVSGTVPIGRPIPGRQVLVLDERDQPCPAGVTGHLVVRSPYVAMGYVGTDPRDVPAFRDVPGLGEPDAGPGRCYRTGDLGRLRFDGVLEFRGRRDEQIKFYGTRVELTDIETALAAHESVGECAVVAVTKADGLVTRLVAYVVPRRGMAGEPAGSADAWRATLRRRFGDSMLPVSFKTLDSLPRNLGGKVDRRKLPVPSAVTSLAGRPPRTPAERGMAEIWSQLLGVEQLSADDTFFAAGGHSLLLLLLADRIRERFGVEVPLWECCANPTLAGLAALVETQSLSTEALKESVRESIVG